MADKTQRLIPLSSGSANLVLFSKSLFSESHGLFEDVPEQVRNTVLFFLRDDSLDAVTKICILRGMGLEESVIQKASDYLDPRPEVAAEEEEKVGFLDPSSLVIYISSGQESGHRDKKQT